MQVSEQDDVVAAEGVDSERDGARDGGGGVGVVLHGRKVADGRGCGQRGGVRVGWGDGDRTID